ncbi:MAG: flavocytochrome c [Desulfobacterales bacterium]|jgi:flavocytochrome c
MNDRNPPPTWHEEADVIVVGSGFAGLAAAIEAKQAGCSVIILEKMKGYGGNSTISDGVIAAAGTPMQADLEIADSAQQMYKDMLTAGLGLNQPQLVRVLTENSQETYQWTIDFLGVKYLDRIDQFGGHSLPRCHTTDNRSGSAIIRQMLLKADQLGMKVRTKTYLQKIFQNSRERVCGLLVREGYQYPDPASGTAKYIKASKAVILATGGFANDIEMRTSQDPRLTRDIGSTNKFSTTGEALREALRIGALPVHLSWIQLGPWACPDEKGYGVGPDFASYIAFPYGVMVDPKTGRRFVNELADRKIRADAILQVGHPCIGIADEEGVKASGRTITQCLRKGVVKKFDQVHEIAAFYRIPLQPLKNTIEQFNRSVRHRLDNDQNKPILSNAQPLSHPPYFCMRLWPKVHHTMGGVLINTKAQVLNLSFQPIDGFFAAGEVTGGVHGACRLGSCAIIDCLVFGRIAGKNAAALR